MQRRPGSFRRDRVDFASFESSKGFSELSTNLRVLIKQLSQNESVMSKGFETAKLQSDKLQNEFQTACTALQSMRLQECLTGSMDALVFPGMLSRQNMIAPSYSKTFDWIYRTRLHQ